MPVRGAGSRVIGDDGEPLVGGERVEALERPPAAARQAAWGSGAVAAHRTIPARIALPSFFRLGGLISRQLGGPVHPPRE